MPRIHITGASGAGTTTLGRALAGRLRVPHFDSDDYYWISPAAFVSSVTRDARLAEDLARYDAWVWSGSSLSWAIDPPLSLCVFLTVPRELQIERLRGREHGRADAAAARGVAAWPLGSGAAIDGAQSTEERVALAEAALAAGLT